MKKKNLFYFVLLTVWCALFSYSLSADENFFGGLETADIEPMEPSVESAPPEPSKAQKKMNHDSVGQKNPIYRCLLEDLQRQIGRDYEYARIDSGYDSDSNSLNLSHRSALDYSVAIVKDSKKVGFRPFNRCIVKVNQLPKEDYKKLISDLDEILDDGSNSGILEEVNDGYVNFRVKKINQSRMITFQQGEEPVNKEMGIKHVLKALGKKAGADETAILDPEFSKLEESSDGAKTKASNWIISLKLLLNHSEKEKTGEVEAKPIRN